MSSTPYFLAVDALSLRGKGLVHVIKTVYSKCTSEIGVIWIKLNIERYVKSFSKLVSVKSLVSSK